VNTAHLLALAERAQPLCFGDSYANVEAMDEPEPTPDAFAAAEELLAITSATTQRAAERWAAARAAK